MSSLETAVMDATKIVSERFGLAVEKSRLTPYSEIQWHEFCLRNRDSLKILPADEGIYVPASSMAYVKLSSPRTIANAFHELFGHGLFCEHSSLGRQIVNLSQDVNASMQYLHSDIPEDQYFGLARNNIWNYEGFALWTEEKLSESTGHSGQWAEKKSRLPPSQAHCLEYFNDAARKMGEFGFMCQMGFPHQNIPSKILDAIRRLYGPEFVNVRLALLYGSRKSESDIDVFVISGNPSRNYFNGWLDIYELNETEFRDLAQNLDISVTDPLFTGTVLHGEESLLQSLKQQAISQSVTAEAISHNLARRDMQAAYLPQFRPGSHRHKACLSYIESYGENAAQLSRGRKAFTLRNLRQP